MPLEDSIGDLPLVLEQVFWQSLELPVMISPPPCLFPHFCMGETADDYFCLKKKSSGGHCQPFLGFYLRVGGCVHLTIHV